MSNQISDRIQEVINLRREQLPRIQAKIQNARDIEESLSSLEVALNKLENHPNITSSLRDHIREFRKLPLHNEITSSLKELEVVQNRLLRQTVNIGVSGQARVGKSTLLQTISGLKDDQIPTGSGIPVTAVRSQLRHSISHERATLKMHTFESFREKILIPYHAYIKLSSIPLTLEEFRYFSYENPQREVDEVLEPSQTGLLVRLRDMQKALPSYEKELTGGIKIVSLEGLRSWVAYPTQEEESNLDCPRRYLAVQDVLIECRFPENEVEDLTVIDLPGLGELDAKAEERHISGLKNEVDLVLLIKRPLEGLAYWKKEDANAADLLDRARGAISNRRDFVLIVVNDDGANVDLSNALIGHIRSNVNEGIDGRHYQVISCNAKDSKSVREQLLIPCLDHLANRLQYMDEEVIESACMEWNSTIVIIKRELSDLQNFLTQDAPKIAGSDDQLNRKIEQLRGDLASSLFEVVEDLYRQARAREDVPDLIGLIQNIADEIDIWIDNALGQGTENWLKMAYNRMRVDKNVSGLAIDELNRVRVEISERYAHIDHYFNGQVNYLWIEISKKIRAETGKLLEDIPDGKSSLKMFSECLESAEEPCEVLKRAVDDLLALKISYRSHFHPRVRERIDFLNFEINDPSSGEQITQVKAEVSKEGAERALKRISDLAIQASYEIKKALLEESTIVAKIFHAAAEQFEDSLIRSHESKWEFGKLGRSYRDEIWPDVFTSIDADNAKIVSVNRAIQKLQKLLEQRE